MSHLPALELLGNYCNTKCSSDLGPKLPPLRCENSYCLRGWFRKPTMWIHEVDRCLGEIYSLSFILCLPCQGEHLFHLGKYSNQSSPFFVFQLIICAERRRYWDTESCLRRASRPRAGSLLLRGLGFRSVKQRASLSLTLVGMVMAMKERRSWKHCLNLFYMWPACGKGKIMPQWMN